MKKHLSLLAILCFAIGVNAQLIPNGDFENWTAGSPVSWATYNNVAALMGITPAPVTQESPAPSGNYYLKAVSRNNPITGGNLPGIALLGNADAVAGTGSIGIPFTQTPAFFSGEFKHEMVASTDSMIILCQLTKWDAANNTQIVVGETVILNSITSVTSWTSFSNPITYLTADAPDSLTIGVVSIGGDGAAVSIDNFAFSATSIGVNNIELTEQSINLFPNPASNQAYLDLSAVEEQLALGVKVEVIDMTGRVVETHLSVRNRLFQLNTSNLNTGKYLVRISNSNMSICKTLVKQ